MEWLREYSAEQIDELIGKILENAHGECGLRTVDEEYEVGDELEASHEWDDGDRTDEELSGTCCTGFGYLWHDGEQEDIDTIRKAIKQHEQYIGKHLYLIGDGNGSEYGSDPGELIISNAKVLAVLR